MEVSLLRAIVIKLFRNQLYQIVEKCRAYKRQNSQNFKKGLFQILELEKLLKNNCPLLNKHTEFPKITPDKKTCMKMIQFSSHRV